MTLQQLQYIVALDRHRHFVKAAGECGISQPTLSAMISRLEEELDVRIFDRSKHPVEPTPMGEEILHQARLVLKQAMQVQELVQAGKESLDTRFSLGVIQKCPEMIFSQHMLRVGNLLLLQQTIAMLTDKKVSNMFLEDQFRRFGRHGKTSAGPGFKVGQPIVKVGAFAADGLKSYFKNCQNTEKWFFVAGDQGFNPL